MIEATRTARDGSSPAQVHRDIQRTREEMDQTLDQLGERLHPRHLLDDLLDVFIPTNEDGPRSEQLGKTCRKAGSKAAHLIRENPIPALLCGAGIAYWIFDQYSDDEETEWEFEAYGGPEEYSETWSPAWGSDYAWGPNETEERWTVRAGQTFDELRQSLSESGTTPHQKLKLVAGKVMSLSGRTREELHSQWADLPEHSGSFVDARTGQPYNASYGREREDLLACDILATADIDESDEHAEGTIQKLKDVISSTGTSAKEMAQRSAALIGDYGRATGKLLKSKGSSAASTGSQWAHSGRQRYQAARRAGGRAARDLGRRSRERAEHARESAARAQQRLSEGVARAQHQVGESYDAACRATTDAIQQYPLAVGAACFGLGLLGGLLLPHTRREDELMGEMSDDLRSQAKETGREVLERGKHVAEATASAAMDEAQRQGLSPEQLREQAGDAVGKAREKAKESVGNTESAASDLGQRIGAVARTAAETARQEAKHEKEEMKAGNQTHRPK